MSVNDPAFKGECTDSVADYDYELAMRSVRTPSMSAGVPPVLRVRSRKRINGRFFRRIASGLVVGLVVGFLVTHNSHGGESSSAENESPNDWHDSFVEVSPVPAPTITLVPEPPSASTPEKPGPPALSPAPQTLCDRRADVPSYQAVIVEGPFEQPPGYYWVAGPEGRPPRIVLPYLVDMWWNWRSIPRTFCHDFILEPWRLR